MGYNAITTADNQEMPGNNFVTSVMAAGSITVVSYVLFFSEYIRLPCFS